MNPDDYQVHLGDQFLTAFAKLQPRIQRRVEEMIKKLKQDPSLPGLNFERILSSRDPRIVSLRVDNNYRAVVLRAQDHCTFIMLWVDKHDDAYDWAARRCATIHPLTGTIQLVEVAAENAIKAPAVPEFHVGMDRPDIFAAYSDQELMQLGACAETDGKDWVRAE